MFTDKNDLIALGEIAALDGISLEDLIARLTSEGYCERLRKAAVKGWRKFGK